MGTVRIIGIAGQPLDNEFDHGFTVRKDGSKECHCASCKDVIESGEQYFNFYEVPGDVNRFVGGYRFCLGCVSYY